MHDDQILDGSDDTTAGSTQIQRRTGLKNTMKAAILILDGLDRSSINDLSKDQEYRDLVHRFLSPLTSRPLQDAIDQANRALKHGLDEISRGMAGIFPLNDIPADHPIRSSPSQTPIPASDLLPPRSQLAATTTASPEPSLSPELTSLALRQRQEPCNPPPTTPLEQIRNDKRKMVTIHFLEGSKKWGATLKDVIDAVNEAVWKRVSKGEQRVLEAWMTTKKDIILACQSSLDAHYSWTEDLDLSHLWDKGTVVHVRRGLTTAYVARIDTDKLTFSLETLELRLGRNSNLAAQMKAQVKHKWGDVEFGIKLGPGIYLCSGSVDILDTLAFPSLVNIIFGTKHVWGIVIIGLRLSDNLDSISYSSTYGFL